MHPKMIPINNSDTAWLIVADFNQENGKYHEELRADIFDPEVDFNMSHDMYVAIGTTRSAGSNAREDLYSHISIDVGGPSGGVGCMLRIGGVFGSLSLVGGNASYQ